MQNLMDSENQVLFVVKVNGVAVSSPVAVRSVAETIKLQLPPEQQSLAVVETVTQSGQNLLLG